MNSFTTNTTNIEDYFTQLENQQKIKSMSIIFITVTFILIVTLIINKILEIAKNTKKTEENTQKILEYLKENQKKISEEQVRKLENYYNCCVDIEWACKNNNIYLIQCRPITT